MIRTINDFIGTWKGESESTLKVLYALTDESLNEPNDSNCRTIGVLANHIVETLTEMPHKLGLIDDGKIQKFNTVKELTAAYQKLSDELVQAISARWTDATLEEERNLYGENWKNSYTLRALMFHQIHHRGQLTILMRMAGLKVPGVYGPAKEEWAVYGMEAPVE